MVSILLGSRSLTVLRSLGGSQGADRMVLLEQQANVFKNYAMFETERQLVPGNDGTIRLVDPDKWKTWCPTKQIARLRAAAGVASYMNDYSASRCPFFICNARFSRSRLCHRSGQTSNETTPASEQYGFLGTTHMYRPTQMPRIPVM